MKTFLWTTLFWIIIAIAGVLCLGFGNLGTQVLDNEWMVSVMPNNLKDKIIEPAIATTLQNFDRCEMAEENNCYPEEEVAESNTGDVAIQESLENIIANQQIIYSYLQEAFSTTNQAISNISVDYVQPEVVVEPVIDEKEQQRLQLQAQIEALQNEMNNL